MKLISNFQENDIASDNQVFQKQTFLCVKTRENL
jgi:hypothetical protein